MSVRGEVTITNCDFTGGTAPTSGGSIFFAGTKLTMTGGSVTGGTSTNSAANSQGGNICINGGTSTISDCAISGGTAVRGGNIWMNQPLTLNNCTVTGGKAVKREMTGNLSVNAQGGNIFVPAAALTLNGCTVTDGAAENGFCHDIYHYGSNPLTLSGNTKIGHMGIGVDKIRIGEAGIQGSVGVREARVFLPAA